MSKDSQRVAAYGAVDELNAVLGMVRSEPPTPRIHAIVERIQNELFHLGADLSTPEDEKPKHPSPGVESAHVDRLAQEVDALMADVGPLENFVLPGGCRSAALLHLARTVCRRAEREVVRLSREEAINPAALSYLNRLSDVLFAMALFENRSHGTAETYWNSRAKPTTD